ncbi:MAG: lipopolysaccharide heptosyltransferase II [Chlorobi bacterium]|nr:lipopolysaccharide heptosyltransferase II [Chlorobiota bacterium]
MKTLVIQTAFAGDLVLTLPLIQSLARNEVITSVDVLCIPGTAPLLENHPDVSGIIKYDKQGDRLFTGLYRLMRVLRAKQYDIVISPHRSFRSALLSYATNARVRISFDRSEGGMLYTHREGYGKSWHEVARNLVLLSPLKIPPRSLKPELHPGENDYKNAVEALHQEGVNRKYVCLAPGSVWPTKRWTIEGFAELAVKIQDDGYKVVLLGGKMDEDICARVRSLAGNKPANFSGRLTWLESAVVIKRASALVSNDSAPVHIASAMETPVLEIYGPTSPVFGFTPWKTRHRLVQLDGLSCAPCAIHGGRTCPIKSHICMQSLSAGQIYAHLIALLGE